MAQAWVLDEVGGARVHPKGHSIPVHGRAQVCRRAGLVGWSGRSLREGGAAQPPLLAQISGSGVPPPCVVLPRLFQSQIASPCQTSDQCDKQGTFCSKAGGWQKFGSGGCVYCGT